MTRLPFESRNIVARPDLPAYELNQACPVTGEVTGLEDHHIVRRSFGPGFREAWWVEVPGGGIVGNRINLSSQAHYRITVNKARIVCEEAQNGRPTFYWVEAGEKTRLRWQPPAYSETPGISVQDDEHPEPGQECKLCKRRVPHPKKATSPKTRVYSTRVPIDDAETFKELVDAAAEHAGLKSKAHHEYNTLLTGLTLILQSPPEHLPGG